jgi:hypothetical protein
MSTEFFRKYINIINESQNDMSVIEGYIENSTQDLVWMLKDMIDGDVPRADNLLDSLNDAYGPGDSNAYNAYIAQHPEVHAVRDICHDIWQEMDGSDDEDEYEAIIASRMPQIKKAYQMALANGYSQA